MNVSPQPERSETSSTGASPDLRLLFHQLNNQLGIVLAHAELLEVKVTDEGHRARAAQIVSSVLGAMATAREIRTRSEATGD